jgi:hypothetical protein
MRAGLGLLGLALLTGAAACHRAPAAGPSAVAAIPVQAPQASGLWEERVFDRSGERRFRYCLDAGTGRQLAAFDRALNGRCTRRDMAEAADGSWRFATRCDMGAWGEVTTEGVMRGDFSSHYRVDVSTQTERSAAANGPGRVIADLRRIGDCPAAVKPGEILSPDGGVFRLEESSDARA